MFSWIKNLFKNPKSIIGMAVDSLDLLVPIMAKEITRVKGKFDALDPTQKSQWVIDTVQAFLRKQFNLSTADPKGPSL